MRLEQGIVKYKYFIHPPINSPNSLLALFLCPKITLNQILHNKMRFLSAIFFCFKFKEEKVVVVEAGSLSSQKPKQDPQRSSAPIVVSYFPVNSQPSRL
uniref:Uncharacterized protein n=2 Tax=Cajanus cajan TaxID=3821 RepID=A0A151QRP7_CAJCA|nr:hypothetical protein KK1_046285 [Cajanus cajan]